MSGAIEVVDSGPLATVQDLGRPGYAQLGVGGSGAVDRRSLRLANRLVGNRESDAAIECTFGNLVVVARGEVMLAVTGATCPVEVDGRAEPVNTLVRVRDGGRVALGTPCAGMRAYVSVRGGVDVAPVLGSRSTDLLSGLGPAPLAPGTLLPVGTAVEPLPEIDLAPVAPPPTDLVTLDVLLGPREDWFDAPQRLFSASYEVSADSDRVGMRLSGPELRRDVERELPSEGVVTGSLQVPPSGQPTLFLADHPVTGGYPVIGVVLADHVDRAAQARPGQRLRFRRATL